MELEELRKMKDSVQQTASDIENSVQSELGKTESELNAAANPVADETPKLPEKTG
jgi:hypothetical protein